MDQSLPWIIGIVAAAIVFVILYLHLKAKEEEYLNDLIQNYGLEKQDLKRLDPGIDAPIYERLFKPFTQLIVNRLDRNSPRGFYAQTSARLTQAGQPGGFKAPEFISLRLALTIVGILIGLLLSWQSAFLQKIIFIFVFGFGLWIIPDLWLQSVINDRKSKIKKALPDIIDLLLITVQSGRGFDQAMANVVKTFSGPLSDEFKIALKDIEHGATTAEALRRLSSRVGVIEVNSFVAAINQAEKQGAGITKALQAQSEDMRDRRFQSAREAAQKIPIAMVFPLTFFIFPALFVVVMGPGLIQIMRAFAGIK